MAKKTEHTEVRLPLIEELKKLGWHEHQLVFEPEWRVPKTPSDASKREAGGRYEGFPVDVAIFDDPATVGDYEHLSIIIETKSPTKNEGINQLKIYIGLEPHVRLGIWTNGTDLARVYKAADGSFVVQKPQLSQSQQRASSLLLRRSSSGLT